MHKTPTTLWAMMLGAGAILALTALWLLAGERQVGAAGPKPPPARPAHALSDQIIPGFPLSMTVEDNGRMQIRYRDLGDQFYGTDAEGPYLWVNVAGTTTVYGPGQVPAGLATNPYQPVSNQLTGAGTPANPWLVTTVNDVPNTTLRLTQQVSYVNGAEFTSLSFKVEQIGGSAPVTATLFHAADLYTAGSDQGYGYYDPTTGGVGDYFTATTGSLAGVRLYQQFVPSSVSAASAYQEDFYSSIWSDIGDMTGPGPGFSDTISDTLHDSGAGLQWNLNIPTSGGVTVTDVDQFSPHASICGSFSDVPYGSYYYDFIYYLACNGIVSGYSDTTFRPSANTTRGQLAKIAANSAGFVDPVSGQTFEDVPPSNGFYPFIERMASRGLISGYTCGGPSEPCVPPGNRPYFRWGADVTRGQLAKIIANARGLNSTPTGQTFADVPSSSPFYLYAERLAALGTISGYSCGGPGEPCDSANRPYFRVGANATRGQISKIDKLTFFP
ncbi:MAG TPA: S-layer homology domain-containing protein [Chloroflexia bacterium]|nr:S-layer homology domain-containing protein [Chloroflexia bacterium]